MAIRVWHQQAASCLQWKLFYDSDMTGTLTGSAQFNGNINGIKWRLYNNGTNQYKGYNFTYDGLNRLTQVTMEHVRVQPGPT